MFVPVILLAAAFLFPVSTPAVETAFGGRDGSFVMIDCATHEASRCNPAGCQEKLPPCSTFKIWNSAIGLEEGILTSPDQPFWVWDGKQRERAEWNHNLTLKEAFAVSCFPAYQVLARQLGATRMQGWLDKLDYGNRDISAGIDVFWVPDAGRKPLVISADEQAQMICKLVNGKLPLSAHTLSVLKEIMTFKKTDRGVLYGKTGAGELRADDYNVAWYVGYVETAGKTFAFACVMKGQAIMGTDVRTIVERILSDDGLL